MTRRTESSQVAIIILAHKNPDQVALLVRTLTHPAIRVYLHVDKRQSLVPFEEALSGLDVRFLPRHPSYWGDPRCVDAAIEGIRAGRREGCDYFALISGQDLPLVPAREIVSFFSIHRHTSFLRHWPIEHTHDSLYAGRDRTEFYSFTLAGRREICVPRGEDISYMSTKGRILNSALRLWTFQRPIRRFPEYAKAMRGDAWWNLTGDAADYVLDFLATHPDYRSYHTHTFAADEVFFASVVAGAGYAGEIASESLRYLEPGPGFHPKVLTVGDVDAMVASGALFARKFDISVDREVIHAVAELVLPSAS